MVNDEIGAEAGTDKSSRRKGKSGRPGEDNSGGGMLRIDPQQLAEMRRMDPNQLAQLRRIAMLGIAGQMLGPAGDRTQGEYTDALSELLVSDDMSDVERWLKNGQWSN